MRRHLVVALLSLSPAWSVAAAGQESEDKLLGRRGGWSSAEETIELSAGTVLRLEPAAEAPIVVTLDTAVALAVVERRGEWVRLRHGDRVGWLNVNGDKPRPSRTARQALIEQLGAPRPLGGFELLTDVGDERLIARLARVAESLPRAYRQRFGLEPPPPIDTVVLFARAEDYATVARVYPEIAELASAGHARRGLASLAVGRRSAEDLTALFVHELTHLINRRVFPFDLPAWLEEAMANDLAYCRVDARGRLSLNTLRAEESVARRRRVASRRLDVVERTVVQRGPAVALESLRRRAAAGRLPSIDELTSLAWRDFAAVTGRDERYAQATFLLRFLLDSEHSTALTAELALRSVGNPVARWLGGASRSELDRDFARWLGSPRAGH